MPGICASVGKESQLLLQPTEVELGIKVGVEFDNCVSQITLRESILYTTGIVVKSEAVFDWPL